MKGMLWKKPANMKYTDMCIYIDENIPNIIEPGKYPEIENTVYNYLWLLVKALAIKKRMFQKFEDYDPFAFHAATRLYLAIRKNYLNQGKTIKGKKIRPIKSSLNYTKAILYPMKLEYQQEAYREIIDEEFVSKKFDAFAMRERMEAEAVDAQEVAHQFEFLLNNSFINSYKILDEVMQTLPFGPNTLEYKYIKISVLLNCVNSLKNKKELNSNLSAVAVWKLPKSLSSYITVIIKEFYNALKREILDCYDNAKVSDDLVDKLLTYKEGPDYTYED